MDVGTIEATLRLRDEMQAALRRAEAGVASFLNKAKGLGAGLDSVGRQFDAVVAKADTFGRVATRSGAALTAGVTLPIGAAIKAAMDFEHTFAQVRKTVEGSEAELAGVANQIRAIGARTPTAVTELNKIAGLGGQLGVPRAALADFTEIIAEVGVASDLTTEAAATAFAQFANIMQMPIGETRNLGSAVINLGNNLATTESKIVEMASRLAGAGSSVGMSEDQVLGFSAALSALGIEAEAGGTALSRTFKEIAVEVATGGENLQNFAAIAGMSVSAFSKQFKEDASGAVAAFVGGLGQVRTEGGDVIKILDDMGISEIRQSDALLRLSGNTALLQKALKLSGDGYRENTALAKEAALFNDTLTNRLKTLGNNLFLVGERIGKFFTPAIKAMTDALIASRPYLDTILDRFESLPTPIKVVAGVLATAAAAAGPLLVALGLLAQALAGLALAGVTGAAVVAFLKVAAVVGGVTAALVAAGGLVYAFLSATGAIDGIRETAGKAWAVLSRAGSAIGLSVWEGFKGIIGGVWDVLRALWSLLVELLRPLIEFVKLVMSSEAAMVAFKVIVAAAASPLIVLGEALKKVGEFFSWIASNIQWASDKLKGWNSLISGSAVTLPGVQAKPAAKNAPAASKDPLFNMTGGGGAGFDPFGANLNLKDLGFQYKAVAEAATAADGPVAKFNANIGEGGKKAKATADAYREMAQAAQADLFGVSSDDVARLLHAEMAIASIGGVTNLSKEQAKKYHDQLGEVLDGFKAIGHVGPKTWTEMYLRTQETSVQIGLTAENVAELNDRFGRAAPAVNQYAEAWKRVDFGTQTRLLGVANMMLDSQIGKLVTGLAPGLKRVAEEAAIAGATATTAQEDGKNATAEWAEGVWGLTEAFANLAEISGTGMDGTLKAIAKAVALMDVGQKAGGQMAAGMAAIAKGGKGSVGGYAQLATGAVSAYATMQSATDKRTRGGRIAGGAMQGAAIGANPALMAASMGTSVLIGAAAGAIYGAVRNPAWADIADRVGSNMGIELTEEMAKSIATTAKKTFGGNKSAAEIFHLGDLMGMEGVTGKSIDMFTRKTRDAFVMYSTGAFNLEQLTNTLGGTFGKLAEYVSQTGKMASKEFVELITLAKQFGAVTEDMQVFTAQQTEKGIAGLGGLLGTAQTVEDLEFIARAAGDLFNGIKGTLGEGGAFAQFSQFLDTLIAKRDALTLAGQGTAGLAGLDELVNLRDLMAANSGTLSELANLDAVLVALGNTGSLTGDRLNEMATAGVESFKRLTEGGMTPAQALKQMEPYLGSILRGYEQLGIPMDEQITALVAQATNMGLLKEEADVLISTLTKGFEGVTQAVYALTQALGGVGGAMGSLPGIPTVPAASGGGGEYTALASGGILNRPTFVAGEAGAEVVAPLSDLWREMDRRGSGPQTVNLTIEMEGRPILRALLPLLSEELRLQGVA
jgi:TP901 family phage tail tape measure protein